MTPLRAGLLAGAASALAVAGAGYVLLRPYASPRFNVEVVSMGRDVTRHGGHRVVVGNERGEVAQSCRGACDDLRLQEDSADNSYRVRVLGADGACVACSPGGYVTNGIVFRLRVSGDETLDIRESIGSSPPTSVKGARPAR